LSKFIFVLPGISVSFDKKYNLDENSIPDLTEDVLPSLATINTESNLDDGSSEEVTVDDDREFFVDEDADPNY
jgi:hypothetical protein